MNPYKISTEIDFTHNVGVTIADIERRLKALSSAAVHIPVTFGKLPSQRGGGGMGGGGSSSFSQMPNYSKSINEWKKQRNSINDVNSELGKLGFQAALTVKRFAAFVGVSAAFIGISNAIRDGLSSAIAYEKQMAKISQVTGTSIKDLGSLDKEITRLSTTLGVSSEKITNVALTLAQAGLNAKDTTKALEVLAKTELTATFEDIEKTGEGVIAVLAQFGQGVDALEGQLGSINTVSAKFAVESSDLVEVIRKSGGAFRATGGELNELLALFTSVRSTTRESAESISTGLRTIFTRLQRNKTVNFLSDLNIDLRDAKGEFVGIYPAIKKLSEALEGISGTDPRFNQIVEELGGFRQVSKVIPLLKQFEVSQKVLSVAGRANNSINRDSAIAQKTLANQLTRVREEFLALSRSYYNDTGIRNTISLALVLASALIKVADAVKPLVPLFGAIGTVSLLKGIGPFLGGVSKQHVSPVVPRSGFSTGGPVPGSGSGDIVPASLEPGEFVIRKSAAKALGQANLHKINKYAGGGTVARSMKIRSIFSDDIKAAAGGYSDHGNLLQNVLNNKELQGYIPQNSKYLTTGAESIVLETPDQRIIRLGLHGRAYKRVHGQTNFGRSKHPLMLQPLFARKFGNVQFELLPKAKPFVGTASNMKMFQNMMNEQGLVSNDFKDPNLGMYNGKMVALDPGTFLDKKQVKRRGFADGGLVGRAIASLRKDRVLSKAQGLGRLFPENAKFGVGSFFNAFNPVKHILDEFSPSNKNSFRNQFGKLIKGARGGFKSGFLAFQDSLGISRDNPLFGDAPYPASYRSFGKKKGSYYKTGVSGIKVHPNTMTRAVLAGIKYPTPAPTPKNSFLKNILSGPVNATKFLASGFTKDNFNGLLTGIGPKNISKKLKAFGSNFSLSNIKNSFLLSQFQGLGQLFQRRSPDEKIQKLIEKFERNLGVKFNKGALPSSIRAVDPDSEYSEGLLLRSRYGQLKKSSSPYIGGLFISKRQEGSKFADRTILLPKKYEKELLFHEFGHSLDYDSTKGFTSLTEGTAGNLLAKKYIEELRRLDKINGFTPEPANEQYRYSKKEAIADIISAQATGYSRHGVNIKPLKPLINDFISSVSKPRKYANGGGVGGYGNKDNVPALLTPGEFVINKRSAQAFGYHNLNKVNKYATGGKVQNAALGLSLAPQLLSSGANAAGVPASQAVDSLVSGLTTAGAALLTFSFAVKRDSSGLADDLVLLKDNLNVVTKDLDNNFKEYSANVKTSAEAYKKQAQSLKAQISSAGKMNGVPTPKAQALTGQLDQLTQEFKDGANAKREEYHKLEQANQATKKKLEADAALKKNTIELNERFNTFSQRVAIGSAALIGLGSAAQTFTNKLSAEGKRGGSGYTGLNTTTEAGLAGAATSGGTGALAGTFIGGTIGGFFGNPVLGAKIGAGVGTAAGIGYGYVSGQSSSESTIKSFEIKKSFEKLETTLKNIQSGRTTVAGAKVAIGQSAQSINEQFFELSGSEFETFRGAVNNSIDGLDFMFTETLKTATSIKDFTQENEELINVLTRFGGITITELEKRIKDEIDAKNKAQKATAQLTNVILESGRRLEATFAITSALDQAESSVHNFGDSLDRLAQFASGTLSDKTNINFSALGNIAGASQTDLARQAQQAAGFIGGPAQGLANDAVGLGQISKNLPSILNDLVLANQLDGDDLIDALKTRLGGGVGASEVISAVNKEIGTAGDSTKFLDAFKQNPIEITKNIQASLQPFVQTLADATPRIQQQFNDFADGLAAARENFLSSLDGLSKSVDIIQSGEEFNLASTGRPLNFSTRKVFDFQRQSSVTGGKDVNSLANNIRQAQKDITLFGAQKLGSKDDQEVKELNKAISANIQEVQVSTRALEFLADVNSRLATVEQERSRLAQIREAKTNVAEGFAFGDSGAKLDTVKGLIGVKSILQNLESGKSPLGGLNDELKQGALGILKQFGDADIFQGKTGNEIIQQVLKADGFKVGPNDEENNVITQGNAIIEQARIAQEALNTISRENNDAFIDGLGKKFDDFFSNLETFFKKDSEDRKKAVNDDINARIEGIEKQKSAIKEAQKITGLGNAPLKQITSNLDDAIQFKKDRDFLVNAINARQDISRDAKGDDLVDTKQVRRFITGDAGVELEKVIRGVERGGGSIESKNDKINMFVQAAFSKMMMAKSQEAQKLFDNLGVADDLKEGLINGAEDAVKIFKKAEITINTPDIPGLSKEQDNLRSTLRAGGGSVFGQRGSDTVPAMTTDGRPYMLTPGEFIMRKSAVDKYGVTALKKMNAGYMNEGGTVLGLNKEEYYRRARGYRDKLPQYKIFGQIKSDLRRERENAKANDASNLRANYSPIKTLVSGKGFQPQGQVQQAQIQKPVGQGQGQINPKLMEEFVRVVDKLAGAKLELQINGVLNVNINASNIEDAITKKFLSPIQDYVQNEINKAINRFASDNGIVNVPVNKKKGAK